MTLVIRVEQPIEKVFGFHAPPIEERNGRFVSDASCPLCGNEKAIIEDYRITHHRYSQRLVCDVCHYWEIEFEGGEDEL